MKQEIYNAVRAYIKAIPKKDDADPAEIYEKSIDALAPILKDMNDGVELSEEEKSDLLWDLESFFITKLHHEGTFLGNPEVQLWFDEHKTDFNYNYWNAYKDFLAESSSNIPQSVIETFLQMIAPLAPHIAEELWSLLGHESSISEQSWPQANKEKLVASTVKIIFQVNGKHRGDALLPKDHTKEDAFNKAKASERVQSQLSGKTLVKEIYVPNKIVNFVVK